MCVACPASDLDEYQPMGSEAEQQHQHESEWAEQLLECAVIVKTNA
jgi:hypothetical protein